MDHLGRGRRVIELELQAIQNLSKQLDNQFIGAVKSLLKTRGRVIVCGMGKSGIVGQKISATLASTGTPSFSMHPGEAFHGDLGMVAKEDIFLALSNSGETDEVLKLLPFLKDNGNILISITGNKTSTLARESSYHLGIGVPEEACPLKLAPTSSTTATLVMGDALALAVMEARDFKPENFARFHPGGSLGRKLLVRIEDEMITENLPTVSVDCQMIDVISIISKGEQGIAVVIDSEQYILGLITDGDLRRAIEVDRENVFSFNAQQIMSSSPIMISKTQLFSEALEVMEKHKINKLLVDDCGKLLGILRK